MKTIFFIVAFLCFGWTVEAYELKEIAEQYNIKVDVSKWTLKYATARQMLLKYYIDNIMVLDKEEPDNVIGLCSHREKIIYLNRDDIHLFNYKRVIAHELLHVYLAQKQDSCQKMHCDHFWKLAKERGI